MMPLPVTCTHWRPPTWAAVIPEGVNPATTVGEEPTYSTASSSSSSRRSRHDDGGGFGGWGGGGGSLGDWWVLVFFTIGTLWVIARRYV